ncbi:hypothetical protein [uncultured Paenibacillus sp.]|uniref:hypothetical protein n=1 Tax=uncultured Paenibacillus sp. TaxID=227322 RepID=UPI0015A9DA5B|nr:hypothetical protein [uncultured Paenibacillus sp.]
MRNIEIYVIEMRGVIQIIGLLPGVNLFDLGCRKERQQAVRHALDLAQLLGVPDYRLHIFGQTATTLLATGMDTLLSSGKSREGSMFGEF